MSMAGLGFEASLAVAVSEGKRKSSLIRSGEGLATKAWDGPLDDEASVMRESRSRLSLALPVLRSVDGSFRTILPVGMECVWEQRGGGEWVVSRETKRARLLGNSAPRGGRRGHGSLGKPDGGGRADHTCFLFKSHSPSQSPRA
jgi:hypothetical protein